jgi:hypothetical protein
VTFRGWLTLACIPLALSLGPADYARLSSGEVLLHVLPAEGRTLAVGAATRTEASAHHLILWTRSVDQLQKGPHVSAIGRFSMPPQIDDLSRLWLDDDDVTDLRHCRPGSCGVKLNAAEMARLRSAIDKAGDNWRSAAQAAFREVVLARARRYVAEGHDASAVYHDERKEVQLDAEFAALASEIALTEPQLFPLTNYLSLYPKADATGIESFLYWSKESLGAKPIVSITHVAMMENPHASNPQALVARKQVYASHYLTASLSFTALGGGRDGTDRYLVYLNHSRSDVLDGIFGGLIRRVIERRLKAEGPAALDMIRRRLESSAPKTLSGE